MTFTLERQRERSVGRLGVKLLGGSRAEYNIKDIATNKSAGLMIIQKKDDRFRAKAFGDVSFETPWVSSEVEALRDGRRELSHWEY